MIGVSSKWTVLPYLERFVRWASGTRMPCSNGFFRARSRAACLDSVSSRRLARARIARPVGLPRTVLGATSTIGLLRSRRVLPAFS